MHSPSVQDTKDSEKNNEVSSNDNLEETKKQTEEQVISSTPETGEDLTSLDESDSLEPEDIQVLDIKILTEPLGIVIVLGVGEEVVDMPILMDKATALKIGNALRRAAKGGKI